MIIDEEQRFGVAQKERFKSVTKNVDVLTLSATPIPRTLNMALSGIRDMSSLEEAPQDRHPVQTYVLEYDQAVINDAVRRELRRGGQVYYLHNKVESIERVAARLQAQIPEAKVGFGHGKMPEGELSEVWRRVMEQEINVLVCTTIIETGVDVPNVNTIIIEDADHMGLSQLHQIRGRVGRSSRRAYAYLTFTRNKVLSEISQKRLAAIREFTEFGSGFKSPCGTWSCGAPAISWAANSTDIWKPWATICISACWARRSARKRARKPPPTSWNVWWTSRFRRTFRRLYRKPEPAAGNLPQDLRHPQPGRRYGRAG